MCRCPIFFSSVVDIRPKKSKLSACKSQANKGFSTNSEPPSWSNDVGRGGISFCGGAVAVRCGFGLSDGKARSRRRTLAVKPGKMPHKFPLARASAKRVAFSTFGPVSGVAALKPGKRAGRLHLACRLLAAESGRPRGPTARHRNAMAKSMGRPFHVSASFASPC